MFLSNCENTRNARATCDHNPASVDPPPVDRGLLNVREGRGGRAAPMRIEFLRSYALGQLPAELSIIVDFHLKTCTSCGDKLKDLRALLNHRTAIAQKRHRFAEDRRKSPRLPTDEPAAVIVLQPTVSGRLKTRVLDASKSGMKLLIPCELMPGAVVQVHLRDLFILAEVRYCRPVGETFHAGVLIQDVFAACE
jgi:hypothetical protein